MKVIGCCGLLRKFIFDTATGKAGFTATLVRNHAAAGKTLSDKQQPLPLLMRLLLIVGASFETVVLFIVYCVVLCILATGSVACIDVLEFAGKRVSTQIAWISSLIFVLLTATLHYLVMFDGQGTSSPGWTSYLG